MAILEKVLEIQRTIKVEKTGEHPKYGVFMKDEDVVNAVRKELNERSIVVTTKVVDAEHRVGTDDNGRYRPSLFAKIDFTFTDVRDGTTLVQSVFGEGASIGDDVSSRKAFTQARKIAFLQLFQIGEVNDSYDSDSDRSAIPDVVNSVAEAESKAKTSKQLGDELTGLIKSTAEDHAHITGPSAIEVGQKVADEIMGKGIKPAVWRKQAAVLEPLIARLLNGEVG